MTRAADHLKQIKGLLDDARADTGYRLWEVFSAWLEVTAISISNSVDLAQKEPREARYFALLEKFGPGTMHKFKASFDHLVAALAVEPSDVLGLLISQLDFTNKDAGMYLSPFELSVLTARLAIGDGVQLRQTIDRRGFILLDEPTAGAGGMIIAFAQEMRRLGHNPQTQLHATAQDLDHDAVLMSYIQLSLMGIPAQVIQGDTLTLEQRSIWRTPFHMLHGWNWKLNQEQERQRTPAAVPAITQPALFGGAA